MVSKFLNLDFEDLKNIFIKSKFIDKNDKKIISSLKLPHSIAFSFALWDSKLSKYNNHKKIYLTEMRSDMIQSLPLIMIGYTKPTFLLLRSIIEDLLKHIYFFDHPIEFIRYTNEEGFRIEKRDLFDYIKDHPIIKKGLEKSKVIDNLFLKYSEFSKLIHGKKVISINSISNIKFDNDDFNYYLDNVKIIGLCSNFLLSIFHKDLFETFDIPEKAFILSFLDKHHKKVFNEIE